MLWGPPLIEAKHRVSLFAHDQGQAKEDSILYLDEGAICGKGVKFEVEHGLADDVQGEL